MLKDTQVGESQWSVPSEKCQDLRAVLPAFFFFFAKLRQPWQIDFCLWPLAWILIRKRL